MPYPLRRSLTSASKTPTLRRSPTLRRRILSSSTEKALREAVEPSSSTAASYSMTSTCPRYPAKPLAATPSISLVNTRQPLSRPYAIFLSTRKIDSTGTSVERKTQTNSVAAVAYAIPTNEPHCASRWSCGSGIYFSIISLRKLSTSSCVAPFARRPLWTAPLSARTCQTR